MKEQTLHAFFEALKVPACKYEDVKKYITKTQQEESQYVGRTNVEVHLNGLHSLVTNCKTIEFTEKVNTNKLVADFKVTFKSSQKAVMTCRLIKESGLRKPHEDGVWGVNVSSFKLVDKKK